ncbi:MAG: MarR family winged helix-turn-helix transcriptional regulator [Terriglobales bacterium]
MGAKSGDRAIHDPGREAWSVLFRLMQDHRRLVRAVWDELDITGAQAELLYCLDAKRASPMVALAEALECNASNVTGIIDKLEARGLIERRQGTADRRVKMVALTKAGQRLRARLLERLSEPPRFIASLSDPDKAALLAMLRRT